MPTNPMRSHYSKNLMDFYRAYKKNRKKEGLDFIEYGQYRDFIKDAFFNIMHSVLHNKAAFILPYSLGYIYIYSRKLRLDEIRIDYNETKKHKKRVYAFHDDTWRHITYHKWDKEYTIFKNKTYYNLKVTKSAKNSDGREIGRFALTKLIKEVTTNPEKSSIVALAKSTW